MSLDANTALADVPRDERLAALCLCILQDEATALDGLLSLLDVTAALTRYLSPEQRTRMIFRFAHHAAQLGMRLH